MPKKTKPFNHYTAHTEEQIRACTVGELQPLSKHILIVDYDPRWPGLFQREAGRIRGALASRAFLIEHTGSTSVPGLPAKPVIVQNYADAKTAVIEEIIGHARLGAPRI